MSNSEIKGEKKCVIADGKRIVTTSFMDGTEMVEEYDVIKDELLLRKVKRPTPGGVNTPGSSSGGGQAGGDDGGIWTVEVGVDPKQARVFNPELDLLKESNTQPILTRIDTSATHQWRIRNLPYDASVFSVTVDDAKEFIVVRTTNKKYFKKIDIPEMRRVRLPLEQKELSWEHKHNTLVIDYVKCLAIKTSEHVEKKERLQMKAMRVGNNNGTTGSAGAGAQQQGCAQQ